MESELLQKLATETLSKEELRRKVERDFSLLSVLVTGLSSPKAAIRYGCAKILMDLSAEYSEELYPYMDEFVALLGSKYRVLRWSAHGYNCKSSQSG